MVHGQARPPRLPPLAPLPGAARFDQLKDHRLPFPTRIVHITVVRDEKARTLEWHDRRSDEDPDPLADLWTLEIAARGLASRLDWKPIPSGVRVTFPAASADVREVMVWEAGTNVPVACVRSHKAEVKLPVRPGRYSVEVAVLAGGKWSDRSGSRSPSPRTRYSG